MESNTNLYKNMRKVIILVIGAISLLLFVSSCVPKPGKGLSEARLTKLQRTLSKLSPDPYSLLDGKCIVDEYEDQWETLKRIDSVLTSFYKNKYHFSCGQALVNTKDGYRYLDAYNWFSNSYSMAEDYHEGWAKVVTQDGVEDYRCMGDPLQGSLSLRDIARGIFVGEKKYEQAIRGFDEEGNPVSFGIEAFTEYDVIQVDMDKRQMQTLFEYDDNWYPISVESINRGIVTIKAEDGHVIQVDGVSRKIKIDDIEYKRTSALNAFFISNLSSRGFVAFSPKDRLRGDEFLFFYPFKNNIYKGRLVDFGHVNSTRQVREIYDYSIELSGIDVPNKSLDVRTRTISAIVKNPVKIEYADAARIEDGVVVKFFRSMAEPEREYTLFPSSNPDFQMFALEVDKLVDASNENLTLEDIKQLINERYGEYHQRYPAPSSSGSSSMGSQLNQEYQRLMSQLNKTTDPVERQSIQAQMSVIKSQMEASQRDFINQLTH